MCVYISNPLCGTVLAKQACFHLHILILQSELKHLLCSGWVDKQGFLDFLFFFFFLMWKMKEKCSSRCIMPLGSIWGKGKKTEKATVKVTEWKNFLRAQNKLNPKEKIKCDFQTVRHKLKMTMIDSQTISVQYRRLHVLIYLSVASKRPLNIRLMPKLTFLANWKRHKLS